MNDKSMDGIEFIKEVKGRFSKLISYDLNFTLIYMNDSAVKMFGKYYNQKISIVEEVLLDNDYDEVSSFLNLKIYRIGLTSAGDNRILKVIGIVDKVDDKYNLYFEIIENEDPMKYISSIQHFKMKREKWYRAIAYLLPDLIFIYDNEGTYLDVIARYENWSDVLTGSALKLIGSNVKDILSCEQSEVFIEKINEVLERNKTIEFEYSLNMEFDIQTKHYSALISPIKGENAVVWVARDITDVYNARMQIQETKEYFELSHKVKTSVISNLNHEVRTPLNIIMNTLEFLKANNNDKTTLYQLKTIEKSSKHLLELFENMLAISEQNMGL